MTRQEQIEKPKCKTCGESEMVGVPAEVSNYGAPIGKDAEPCPDCQPKYFDMKCQVCDKNFSSKINGIYCPTCQPQAEQPPASEFTKEVREICKEQQNEKQPFIAIEIVEELCAKLDSLELQLAEAKEKAIKAIQAEPELPGGMPDEMWEIIKSDRDATTKTYQIAIRKTKENIIKRFEQVLVEKGE